MVDSCKLTVGQKRPGETIHLLVMRDSKPTSVAVKLEALGGGRGTETAGGEHGKGRWGLSLGDLTPDVRNELQGQEQAQGQGQGQGQGPVHGAVVEDVQPG